MKSITIGVLLLLIISVPAFALGPSPYVGLNVQSNSPTGDFAGEDADAKEGGADAALGGEFDIGLTTSRASAYVGYRFGKHTAGATAEIPEFGELTVMQEWKINRIVLGGRWHIFGSIPSPVIPTVGGGITIGKTTASVGGVIGDVAITAERDSKISTGWFAEGGLIVRLPGSLSLIGDVQYHNFDAEFDTELFTGTVNISFFTVQAGLRLALN